MLSNLKNIYFVRHGESEANSSKIFMGAEAKLTRKGIKQSELIAERVSSMQIDTIISSPMIRAVDTANIIQKKIGGDVVVSDLFVERKRPTEILGMSYGDPKVVDVMNKIKENSHIPDYHYSDEENFIDLRARAVKSLEYIENIKEENILIVTHGVFMRCLIAQMCFGEKLNLEMYVAFRRFFKTWNTGISRMELKDGKWVLYQWNDSAHLG